MIDVTITTIDNNDKQSTTIMPDIKDENAFAVMITRELAYISFGGNVKSITITASHSISIAECPRCGKHEAVIRNTGTPGTKPTESFWCLACDHHWPTTWEPLAEPEPLPTSKPPPEETPCQMCQGHRVARCFDGNNYLFKCLHCGYEWPYGWPVDLKRSHPEVKAAVMANHGTPTAEWQARFNAVAGVCVQCGRVGPCDVGCEVDGAVLAFCNHDCYGAWNAAHGLLPTGELPPLVCEHCQSPLLEAMGCNEELTEFGYRCRECGGVTVFKAEPHHQGHTPDDAIPF